MSDLELKPIHLNSWDRFWLGFDAVLSQGVGDLVERLVKDGVCASPNGLSLILKSEPGRRSSAEEEHLARVRGSDLDQRITVLLQVGNQSRPWELGRVPLFTERGTFIRGGADYAMLGQFTHSYGVFLHHPNTPNSAWDFATIIPVRSQPITVRMGKNKRKNIIFGSRSPVAWSTLWEVLELPDPPLKKQKTVAKAIGLADVNEAGDSTKLLASIRSYITGLDLGELGRRQLNCRLIRFGLNEHKSSTISVGMLDSIVSLLEKFSENKNPPEPEDDWSDLGNLRVRLVDDFLKEALDGWLKTLYRRILAQWNGESRLPITDALIEANNLDSSSSTSFTGAFRRWTVEMPICQRIPSVGANYVAAVALSRRLTFNGPGGIRIGHQRIPRSFKWSHYGRLCPFDTPQSVEVGVTLSLAAGARINDLGQIESRCYAVRDGKRSSEIVWLSPLNEIVNPFGGIAFPDERHALENGQEVYAHWGLETLKRVQPSEVTHIHVSENAMVSIAASLVPYREHNDAVRMNMACNFLRQALPLNTASAPRILAGNEASLPMALPFDAGLRDAEQIAFGADLVVGYVIWKGWNFEDAIVISESAAEVLTSLHFERLEPVRLSRSVFAQEIAYLTATQGCAPDNDFEPDRFDKRGFIKNGTTLEREQIFLMEPSTEWRKTNEATLVPFKYKKDDDDYHGSAVVHGVETCDDEQGRGWMRVVLRRERRAQVGDKLANRHGHKGVISRILPDHEMPYVVLKGEMNAPCVCGETRRHLHMQVLINPLSVISRMNLGQLFETSEARRDELAGLPEKLACHDPSIEDIGARALDDKVLVGTQYVMKLDHNAEDKLHARATEDKAYSAFVQQPLGGRRLKGGQRLGEMEVWALQAHGVPHLLQEMLTLKSDNPWSRRILLSDIATGGSKAESELPEALRTFTAISYGLGLRLTLVGRDKHWLDPASDDLPPDDAVELQIELLNDKSFASKGTVTTPMISGRNELPRIQFHKDGLESEALFGPIEDFTCACGKHRFEESGQCCVVCGTPILPRRMRRRRMAHIELAKPVPNPFILFSVPVVIGSIKIAFDPVAKDSDTAVVLSGILDNTLEVSFRPKDPLGDLEAAVVKNHAMRFVHLCVLASDEFRVALEDKLGHKILVEALADEPLFDRAVQWLFNEVFPGLTALAAAGRCGKVVNELLSKSVNCPVDFVEKLLQLRQAPESILLSILPVIPPDLRKPFEQDRMFKRNDLTILYQALLYANQDLRKTGPEDFVKYRQLRSAHFRAIARLMCNQRLPFSARAWDSVTRQLRESLSSLLAGKEGLLVGNLLGKRVDFSARAVIVPDPNLPMDSCVLPFGIAIKLYEPLLRHQLRKQGVGDAVAIVKLARRGDEEAVKIAKQGLCELFKDYWVVLNRQPTLHRLGMLTFKPVLGSGSVIALPAMVTAGFNADFDGDQMAVYLPLTEKARAEAKELLPSRHLWRPRDGRLALSLAQDIALGAWLMGKGTVSQAAEALESRVDDPNLIEDIESSQTAAFLRATQSGTSVSIEDFRALGSLTSSGDEEDIGTILKENCNSSSLGQIVTSGARGDPKILSYLAGTKYIERRGSNLTDGLRLGERFHHAQEGRQNVVETKLGTAEGGGLTKRFVASSQHIRVTSEDCGSAAGLSVTLSLAKDGLKRWIYGKVLAMNIASLELEAGTVIGGANFDLIQEWLSGDANRSVIVRSPTHCKDSNGVCRACFGVPPWHGLGWTTLDREALAPIGTAVGLIAAQSAGEPGTQMALRRKHHAGQGNEIEENVIFSFKEEMKELHKAFSMINREANTVQMVCDEVGDDGRLNAEEDFGDDDEIQSENGDNTGGLTNVCDVMVIDAQYPSNKVESTPHVAEDSGVTNYERCLAAVDAFLVKQGIELSIIHLDTMIRGNNLSNLAQWIAQLAAPGSGFEARLASSALYAETDSLTDLRSQTVVGGKTVADGEARI